MHTLPFPTSGEATTIDLETSGPVVIIGANGSGKSRLGAWIEERLNTNDSPVLRISAQKSLQMPSSLSLSSPDSALEKWTYGKNFASAVQQQPKNVHLLRNARYKGRWGNHPVTGILDDYGELLEFLLADHSTEMLRHTERIEAAKEYLPLPETRLSRLKRIWEELLPGRELLVSTGKIQTQPSGGTPYNGSEMSDGERVVFYLIGSCISAREHAILLIDEPELHLHRLIQRRLWDSIERERSDCLFVYFTHDVEFAASRFEGPRIALESFDGLNVWEWTYVPEDSAVPEDVLLSIIGSRKPVLFVEGDESSLDVRLYSHVYPNHSVVPVISCGNVIAATASFGRHQALHRITSVGLIDRDQRTDEELASLARMNVFTTGVSEAESLLMAPLVLRCVADILHRDRVDELIQKISDEVIESLYRDCDRIATKLLNAYVEDHLTRSRTGVRSEEEIANDLLSLSEIVKFMGETFRQKLETVIAHRDYEAALRLYPHKGLASIASKHFGLNNYQNEVLRLLQKACGCTNPQGFGEYSTIA